MMAAAAFTLVGSGCCCCPPSGCVGTDVLLLPDMLSVDAGSDVVAADDCCYDADASSKH